MSQDVRNGLRARVEQLDDLWHGVKSYFPIERIEPAFCVIGSQKSGTTTLYDQICDHPQVRSAIKKEIHHFDKPSSNISKAKYLSYFPQKKVAQAGVTGEATPAYLFYPEAAENMYRLFPGMKLLILLRNPVERAISHYFHNKRLGLTSLSFSEALQTERELATSYADVVTSDPGTLARLMVHSYILRGHYQSQIEHWLQFFPRHQMMIVTAESLFEDSGAVLNQVYEFLGLYSFEPRNNGLALNKGIYSSRVAPDDLRFLREKLASVNSGLKPLYGVNTDAWL